MVYEYVYEFEDGLETAGCDPVSYTDSGELAYSSRICPECHEDSQCRCLWCDRCGQHIGFYYVEDSSALCFSCDFDAYKLEVLKGIYDHLTESGHVLPLSFKGLLECLPAYYDSNSPAPRAVEWIIERFIVGDEGCADLPHSVPGQAETV